MAKDDPALVAGDHRADGAGAEVLGAGGGGGLWAGHRRQGNRLRRIFTEYLLVGSFRGISFRRAAGVLSFTVLQTTLIQIIYIYIHIYR